METQAVAAPTVPLIRWVALGAQPCEDEQRHRRLRKSALRQEDGSSPWRALPFPYRAPVLYSGYIGYSHRQLPCGQTTLCTVVIADGSALVMVHSSVADVDCLRPIRCTSSTVQRASSSAKRASPLSMVRPDQTRRDPRRPFAAHLCQSIPSEVTVAWYCAEHRRFDGGHRTRVPCSPHALGGAQGRRCAV